MATGGVADQEVSAMDDVWPTLCTVLENKICTICQRPLIQGGDVFADSFLVFGRYGSYHNMCFLHDRLVDRLEPDEEQVDIPRE
jgi:hypothetical protein